ncbi:hypothetical protein ACLIA0_15040 [Bacillaceae bacterium W0354]
MNLVIYEKTTIDRISEIQKEGYYVKHNEMKIHHEHTPYTKFLYEKGFELISPLEDEEDYAGVVYSEQEGEWFCKIQHLDGDGYIEFSHEYFRSEDDLFNWLYLTNDNSLRDVYVTMNVSLEDMIESQAESISQHVLLKDYRCFKLEDNSWVFIYE